MVVDYAAAGPITDLAGVPLAALETLAVDPVSICAPVQSLVIQPGDARELGLAEERFAENQIRPARELVTRLLGLDPAPLSSARPPGKRWSAPAGTSRS
ncbi:MAG TPA: hypothetical protein VE442_13145 [Jatrophihabitans sp.]|nr:hypothetical protein [Jatrophihabitans sp.]